MHLALRVVASLQPGVVKVALEFLSTPGDEQHFHVFLRDDLAHRVGAERRHDAEDLNGRPEEIGRDGAVCHVNGKWLYYLPTVLVSAWANHHRFDVGRFEVGCGAHVPSSFGFCPDGEDVVFKEIADIVRRRAWSVSSPGKVSFLGDTSERWLSVDVPCAKRLAFGVSERLAQLVEEAADGSVASVHDPVKVVVVTDLDCCVDLRGVVEREQAALGVLLTLNAPTKAMRTEAASAGFYASPWGQHPRVQILTVGELMAGKKLDAPPPRQTSRTYKRAPKALKKAGEQPEMFGDG